MNNPEIEVYHFKSSKVERPSDLRTAIVLLCLGLVIMCFGVWMNL